MNGLSANFKKDFLCEWGHLPTQMIVAGSEYLVLLPRTPTHILRIPPCTGSIIIPSCE